MEAAHSESEAMKERLQAVTEEVNRCRAYNDRLIQETDKLTELEERWDWFRGLPSLTTYRNNRVRICSVDFVCL